MSRSSLLESNTARKAASEGGVGIATRGGDPAGGAGALAASPGDAAATPVQTTLKLFRHEFEAHVKEGRCTLPSEWRSKHPVMAGHH